MKRIQLALFKDGSDLPLFVHQISIADDVAELAQVVETPGPQSVGNFTFRFTDEEAEPKPEPRVVAPEPGQLDLWEIVGWVLPAGADRPRWRLRNHETMEYREFESPSSLLRDYDRLGEIAVLVAQFLGIEEEWAAGDRDLAAEFRMWAWHTRGCVLCHERAGAGVRARARSDR